VPGSLFQRIYDVQHPPLTWGAILGSSRYVMAVIVTPTHAVIYPSNRSPGVGCSVLQCASPSVHIFLLQPCARARGPTDAATLHRRKHSRNCERLSNLWRSLHRVCSTLPTETSPDSRLGRWMAKYSWPSRGCIFYRIRASEHDLGSGVDRESESTLSDHTRRGPISNFCFLHNRMAISTLPPVR